MVESTLAQRVVGLRAAELRARLARAAPSDEQLESLLVDLGVVVGRQAQRARRVAERLSTLRWLGDVFVELGYCDGLTLSQTLQRAGLPMPLGEFLRDRGWLTSEQLQRAYTSLGAGASDPATLWSWLTSEGVVAKESRLPLEAERHHVEALADEVEVDVLRDHVPGGGDARWVPLRGEQGPVIAIQELGQLDQLAELTHRLGEEPRFMIASGAWIARAASQAPAPDASPASAQAPEPNEVRRLLAAVESARASELLLESAPCATRVWLRVDGVARRRPDLVEGFAETFLAWLEGEASAEFRRRRGVRVWSAQGLHGPCVRVACASGRRVLSLAEGGVPGAVRELLQREVLRPTGGLALFVAPKLCDAVCVLESVLHDARAHHDRLFNALSGSEAVPGVVRFDPSAARDALELQPEAIALSLEDAGDVHCALAAVARGVKVYAAYSGSGALEVLARLRQQGASALDLATHLLAVVNVRTVRELCPECRELDVEAAEGTSAEARQLQLASQVLLDQAVFRAGGCEACTHVGYRASRPLLEPILASDALRVRLLEDPQPRVLWGALQHELKLPTLIEAGLDLVALGVTSLAELSRALPHEAPWNQAHGRSELSLSAAQLSSQDTDEDTCWTRQYRTSGDDAGGADDPEELEPLGLEDASEREDRAPLPPQLPTLAPDSSITRLDFEEEEGFTSAVAESAQG